MNSTLQSTRLRALARTVWGVVVAGVLGLTLSACGSLPQPVSVDFVEPATAQPVAAAPAARQATSGSLFQKVSYRPAFEDLRARMVGDVITIRIVETVAASQVSKSTANRTTSGAASVSAFPLVSPADLVNLKAGVRTSSANDFSGKGGTESANAFTGTITATVVNVLPNGNLVVATVSTCALLIFMGRSRATAGTLAPATRINAAVTTERDEAPRMRSLPCFGGDQLPVRIT